MEKEKSIYRTNEILMPVEVWEKFSASEKDMLFHGNDEEIERLYTEKFPEIFVEIHE